MRESLIITWHAPQTRIVVMTISAAKNPMPAYATWIVSKRKHSSLRRKYKLNLKSTRMWAKPKLYLPFNPFTPKSDFIDFTLSNARRFYSSKGGPLGEKGLKTIMTWSSSQLLSADWRFHRSNSERFLDKVKWGGSSGRSLYGMKGLGIFVFRVSPSIKFTGAHFHTWVDGEKPTVRVKGNSTF